MQSDLNWVLIRLNSGTCRVPEDVEHYLINCSKFGYLRNEMMSLALKNNTNLTSCILLNPPKGEQTKIFKIVFKFVLETGYILKSICLCFY